MANQLTARSTLLVSTAGVPATTDVITTDNKVLVNPKANSITYNDIGNGSLGNEKSIINDDYVTADFSADVLARPSGTAGSAPSYAELLKICGMGETVDAGISVTYAPTTTFVNATAKAYLDGSVRTITGMVGDISFSGNVGEIAKFSFSLKGFTDFAETTEANPAVTLDSNANLIVKSVTAITVGGTEIDLKSFDFSLGNDIQETYALNKKEFYINDYKPTVKVTAVKTKGNATHWTDLAANTKKSVVVVLGSGAGGVLTLTFPFCQPSDANESDDSGKVVYDQTWTCENSAGNDNYSIVYS